MSLPKERNKYPIGTQYKTRGKSPKVCTVVDRLRTYNESGELVAERYVSTHKFMGQTVKDRDVLPITIAMSIINP